MTIPVTENVIITEIDASSLPVGRTANAIVRQLIRASVTPQAKINLIYRDLLRSLRNLFGQLHYISEGDQLVRVPCIAANPERSIAELVKEDNLILPITSISKPTTTDAPDRLRFKPLVISEKIFDTNKNRAFRIVSLVPKAVNIEYVLSVWAMYVSDLDQLSQQIHLMFNPDVELVTSTEEVTKVYLVDEMDESAVLVADREDRMLQKKFILSVETYIPSPKFLFTSTGKLEEFKQEVCINSSPS